MDTDGCSAGFPPRSFGENITVTSRFHIPGAAGRWGGLNQPPAGFRDAPTQENQVTPLARLQTVVYSTRPGLRANYLPLQQGASLFFLFTRPFSHGHSHSDCWSRCWKLEWTGQTPCVDNVATDKPVSHLRSWSALFFKLRKETGRRRDRQLTLSSLTCFF